MHNSKNHPLASSIVGGGKNPGTSHMDQREKKIFEIYSSSNPKGGAAAANQNNQLLNGPIQGPQAVGLPNQNSFLQSKY